jgi:NAD(P)-dependent dehydrogenase (short-subunit alcohol dehydrogenase family)
MMHASTDLNLSSRRVLVTGGASGIGLACATLLVKHGAQVAIADLNQDALSVAQKASGAQHAQMLDVADMGSCDAAVSCTVERLGGLDALVNSAGISDKVVPALELDIDDWQRVVDVNLRGTFLMCRAAGRVMVAQSSGAIVNVSSIYGMCGIPRRNAYGPSKAAINMLTGNLASEWGSAGVRVNAIAPGYIETPMIASLVSQGKIDGARLATRTPMARLGNVEEVAWAAAFLLSSRASYITGAVLPVDGGWAAYGGAGDVSTA